MWDNKKKTQKKQVQKPVQPVTPKEIWGDYYYMTSSSCTVVELVAVLQEQGITGLEVWPEMGVLEWPTAPERSIDIETLETFTDAEDAMFLKKNNIQSIFSLHISNLDEDTFLKYFEAVLNRFGGAVCCDTTTFEPIVMGRF